MTAPMRTAGDRAIRVLEVGPGTGIVTESIVRHLPAAALLDVVELQQEFVRLLEHRFETEAVFRAARGRTRIHHMSLQRFADALRSPSENVDLDRQAHAEDATPDGGAATPAAYDFIISGLPLNNFQPAMIAGIFEIFRMLLKPAATLSYFEYMYVRQIRRAVSFGKRRRRIERLDRALTGPWRHNHYRRDRVWLNLPPAWVHHLLFDA